MYGVILFRHHVRRSRVLIPMFMLDRRGCRFACLSSVRAIVVAVVKGSESDRQGACEICGRKAQAVRH